MAHRTQEGTSPDNYKAYNSEQPKGRDAPGGLYAVSVRVPSLSSPAQKRDTTYCSRVFIEFHRQPRVPHLWVWLKVPTISRLGLPGEQPPPSEAI